MKILLIDADGDFPNPALMKLSTHHKDKGDEVKFGSCESPNIVYISCVFTKNREKALQSSTFYPDSEIHFGGTGFNLSSKLDENIEHLKPDYSLYPHVDYSLGFTTRGCIRNIRECPWCVIPKKEGMIRKGSPLTEFIEPSFNKILLLDNNLLSYEKHKDILNEIIQLDKKTCFSQGLDIRLVTEENAELLSQIKYYDTKFKHRRLYFAWDTPEIEEYVKKGIKILTDFGIKLDHLMFYVLMCFNTNYDQDLHRLETLLDLGVRPYVMLYNEIKGTYQHHMKRWIERLYYQVVPWEKYDYGDSQLHINNNLVAHDV